MANGTQVELTAGGESFSAYCAGSVTAGGPALVVIQEIFGVNSHIREVCDRFADEGFTALAPDMFHRQQANVELGYEEADMGPAFGFMQALEAPSALADLAACIQWLRDQGATKVGVVGFCMGGLYTYLSAAGLDPDAAVAFYGGGIGGCLDQASNIDCPIMFHFGERDDHIPMDVVASVEAAVAGLADATVYTYDAEHGFHCDQRGSYDQAASTLAWQRAIDFFRQHLG